MEAVRVLVVEDEILIADMVISSLEDEGFAVDLATDGDEASKLLADPSKAFRAVITDIRFPGSKTGWDIGHLAREGNPDIPVVYVSGDQASAWSVNGVPNSIFIQKPFVVAQIVTALTSLLNT